MSEARTMPRPQHPPQHLSRCLYSPLSKQPHHLATIPCLHPPVLVIGLQPSGRCSRRLLLAARCRRQATLTLLYSASPSPSSLWLSPNLEVAPQPGRSVPDSLLKMTMVQLLPLAATTSRRLWMTDLSTTRGRPRESAAKTQAVELPREALELRAGTGAGRRACRGLAAGKGLPWSRALVTLNHRPVPALMASVWRDTTLQRTGTERPTGQRGSTSSCRPRTRSGSAGCSKKSHTLELLQRGLRVST